MREIMFRNTTDGQWMVLIIFAEEDPTVIENLMGEIQKNFPQISCLYYSINQKNNDSYEGLTMNYYAGDQYLTEKLEDYIFKIHPKSFFQTNPKQSQKRSRHVVRCKLSSCLHR